MEQSLTQLTRGNTTLPLQTKGQVSGITRMEQSRTFMGDDTLSIEVKSATPLTFAVGDIISVHGDPYIINKMPAVKKEGSRHYTYTLELEGRQYGLLTAQFILFDNITDAMVAAPSQYTLTGLMLNSLTGTAEDILKMIVLNANRVAGDGKWVVGSTPASTDTLLFTLEAGTCLEALQKLCEQWELEWAITTDSTTGVHTISLTAEPTSIPETPAYAFGYGKTAGLYTIERTTKDTDLITRLYAYGGTTNIPSSYLTESDTNRLCIRYARKKHLSYVENTTLKATYGIRECVETFDDIYPQRVGSVTGILTTGTNPELRFKDSNMFDLNEIDSETGETKYLIAGTTAKVTFQTGQLAGYTFDIVSWTDSTRTFKIKATKEEGDLTLPSPDNAAFQIAVGDKYILTDINLPAVYITDAETQLKQMATKRLAQLNDDLYQYNVEVDTRYVKAHATEWGRTTDHPFVVGDFVGITDTALGISVILRLTKFTHDLLNDKYTLTIERYNARIKTTQTYHRRRRWNLERLRMERVNTDIDHDVTQQTSDEVTNGRGGYDSLAARYTAVEGTASTASTNATNALNSAAQANAAAALLQRYANSGSLADRHIDTALSIDAGILKIPAGATITDSLFKEMIGATTNKWAIQEEASFDLSDGTYEAEQEYDLFARLDTEGSVEYFVQKSGEEAEGDCLKLGTISEEDGNGERTYTEVVGQTYLQQGVLRDAAGNAVLDIAQGIIRGATKFSGLKDSSNNDIDIVSLLGSLPTTAGGLRKMLADAVDEIGDENTAGTILYREKQLEDNKADSSNVPTIAEINQRITQMQTLATMINTIYSEMSDWNTRISTWTASMQAVYPSTPDFPSSKTTCAHEQLDQQKCSSTPDFEEITRE